jgi:acyl-CoA synthetase (NDP forming)/GNAT superfamily N-acetyltransferase
VGAYPAELEADVVLSDGGTVHVRAIRPDDAPQIEALHSRLSAETIYLRFFSPLRRLSPQMLERFTHVDYEDRLALIAQLGDDIIGVARYDRLPGTAEAEVAFVVDDRHQGRGLGMLLLEHLAVAARGRGIERFVAETLPGNSRMLGVFRDAGFREERRFDSGVVRVAFPIEPTPESLEARDAREERASARSARRLLAPRSIVVVGASRQPQSIGHELFVNLLRGGFEGPVYPVHPTARQVASVRAYPSIVDIPDEVDLAVIVVPAEQVAAVVEDCGRKQVGGLVIISTGFADAGPEGAAAERQLVELARGLGMRMIGPNCLGVVNTAPSVSMNATFAPLQPVPGRVGFSSQSGTLGIAILDELNRLGLGVSTFVSLGNKADVSSNDLLNFWQDDEGTDVVLMYLETFGNPRTFARIVRRLSRRKPIVAVKSARAGQRGEGGGTGSETTVVALFRQAGVIRVDTLEQLFDVAQFLVHQPLPAGRRVAIIGNAQAPALLAAQACEHHGLDPADPVQLGTNATGDDYQQALRAALDDPDVDAVIVVFIPPLAIGVEEVAAGIRRAAADAHDKPIVANFLSVQGIGAQASEPGVAPIPSYRYPESAALALALVADYADWRRRRPGVVPAFADIDAEQVRAAVDGYLRAHPDGGWLSDDEAASMLRAYAIPVAPPAGPAPGAIEVIAGIVQDPSFGPVLTLGVAGPVGSAGTPAAHSAFSVLGELSYRVLPLTDTDATELVESVRGAPLLLAEKVDVAALEDLLLRLAALAEDVPELAEADLRPVVASSDGVTAGAARLRLAPWQPRPEMAVRRLR